MISTDIRIIFAKAVYNICTAGLSLYQHVRPEHARFILRIQRCVLILDAASLGSDMADIRNALNERVSYQPGEKNKKWYQSPAKIKLVLAASTAILIAFIITPYAVFRINQYVQPTFDISKLFHAIKRSSDVIDYTISWSVPTIQQWAQWIFLNRIFANAILAAMPKQKLTHRILYLYSSLTQLISLITISNLFWIKVEKPFSQQVEFEDGEVLKYNGIVKLEFFVPPSTIANHLQATAKGIYNYMAKEWKICLWNISTHYYSEIHRFKVPTPQLSSIPGVGQLFLDQPRVVLTEPQTGFFLTGAVDQGSCAP